jgi:hypothetical protein
MYTTYLCTFGLNISSIHGVLDNSDKKIGKYLYGFNLFCYSLQDIVKRRDKTVIILNGGPYNKELHITSPYITLI